MNNKGQITVEYILLIGIIITILLYTTTTINNEIEKNQIIHAAQIGTQNAIGKNAYAIYYNDTFNNYQENYPLLLITSEIKIIKINTYENNNTIELEVQAHTTKKLTNTEKYIIGQRINYYLRKSVHDSFNNNTTDTFYENIKTKNYKIKTKEVKWF